MLLTAFLIFLVFTTYTNATTLTRLAAITVTFALFLLINSLDVVGLSSGISLYNNWFSLTPNNIALTLLLLAVIVFMLVYNTSTHRYDLKSPYYVLLVLANVMGLILFPLVNDLLTLYVVVELQSYSLYLLTGLHNRSYNASRASMLYFLMGGIASTIILLASYFIYGSLGTTNLSDLAMLTSYQDSSDYFDILLVALMFKMGLAPLHRWSISVYNYAPTYITAYISLVAKVSIMAFIFNNSALFSYHIFMIFFYLSLGIAAYKPLYQVNIKTILAYSGVLNFGYILLAVITYDPSFYIYIIQYVITHLILFLSILAAGQYVNSPISTWSPLIYIHQLKLPNFTLALCLILALFSLIGIPPLPGFYGKYFILSAALQDNYVLETLAVVVCSVIATYFYANIIKILINSSNDKAVNTINPSLAYMISFLVVLLFSFFLFIPSLLEGIYLLLI